MACGEDYRCKHNISFLDLKDVILVKATTLEESILLTYSYVVNIMSTNAMAKIIPTDKLQLITVLLISAVFMYTTIRLIGGFTSMMWISSYSMGNYEYNINELRIYLQVI